MNIYDDLIERKKELDCLYEIAALLVSGRPDDRKLLAEFADSLARAMTYPEISNVSILSGNGECLYGRENPCSGAFCAESVIDNYETIKICIWYDPPSEFVEREKKLVISAASLLSNALLKENYYKKLEEKTEELKTKNSALKEILFQIDQDREEYINSIKNIAETQIFPLICELENSFLSPRQTGLINQIKLQLESLSGSLKSNLKGVFERLTPREVEICTLIKNGTSTKEIAMLLNIAPQTVERHRNTIRKKLGINGKNINLIMYLRNMY